MGQLLERLEFPDENILEDAHVRQRLFHLKNFNVEVTQASKVCVNGIWLLHFPAKIVLQELLCS